MTVISSMIQSIRKAAAYNRHELAPPRVILWPDEERLWGEVIDLLRANHPALCSLGDYDPGSMGTSMILCFSSWIGNSGGIGHVAAF